MRTVTLPDGVDGEKVTAELKDGILEITAPIARCCASKEDCGKEWRADQWR